MTTWRVLLLDQVEAELRSRFGRAIIIDRRAGADGSLNLAATWPEGGGAYIALAADTPFHSVNVSHSVEHITGRLWEFAPIAGSC